MRIQDNIVLGKGKKGLQRKAALELWAESKGCLWNGRGSISRVIQLLADEIITRPDEWGLKFEEITERTEELENG